MENINIFIAGAKDLVEARRVFKVLANNLNAEYGSKQLDVSITMRSYENFVNNNNQPTYDDYIVKESDIVIFVIEGRIGTKTEEEFKVATQSLAQSGHPKVFVFMKQYDELTPDIAYINGLMSNLLRDYYYTYRSYDHLESIAKDVLRETIDSITTTRISKGRQRARRSQLVSWLKMQRYAIVVLLFAIMTLGTFMFVGRHRISKEQITIVVGGGSVANYVEDSLKLDLNGYDDLVYFHMPSMASLSILGEEITDPNQRLYTVVFAAERADTMDFYSSVNIADVNTETDGLVLGAYLGDDPLCAIVEDDSLIREYVGAEDFERGRISLDALKDILEADSRFDIYTTSMSSGTRKRYADLLLAKGHTLGSYKPFNETETIVPIPGYPSVRLASGFYTSKDAKGINTKHLKKLFLYDVVNGEELPLVKRMYVYFVGCGKLHDHSPQGLKQTDETMIYVPQPILDFLQDLGVSTEQINDDNYLHLEVANRIFYLNE